MGPGFRVRERLATGVPANPPIGWPVMAGGDLLDPATTCGGPDVFEFGRGFPDPTSSGHCGSTFLSYWQ